MILKKDLSNLTIWNWFYFSWSTAFKKMNVTNIENLESDIIEL